MPIHAPFWGVFGAHFPQYDVTHCPNPKKDHPWAEPRYLSHIPRKSVARFELGVGARKKGLDRKKVTKGLYFTYLWRSPHWSTYENLCSGWCSQRNHVCQVSEWNFQGLQFYRGSNRIFIFLLILNGPYNSALSVALLCYLWWVRIVYK